MRAPVPYQQKRIARECGKWLSEQSFNVAATVTLCQAVSYKTAAGTTWVRGDPVTYGGIYSGLIKRLSKELYGRRSTERGKLVPNGGSIEGDGKIVAYHFHVFMKRPDWKPFDEFKQLVEQTWLQSPWVKTDLQVEEIHGGWVHYSTKEGPDVLLLA